MIGSIAVPVLFIDLGPVLDQQVNGRVYLVNLILVLHDGWFVRGDHPPHVTRFLIYLEPGSKVQWSQTII